MNNVTLSGKVAGGSNGKDAIDLICTPNGKFIANFSIGVSEKKYGEDGYENHFFNCVCFGKTAETLSNLADRGTNIQIVGKLSQEQWDDKNTGQKRSMVKVKVMQIGYLDGETTAKGKPTGDNSTPQNDTQEGF